MARGSLVVLVVTCFAIGSCGPMHSQDPEKAAAAEAAPEASAHVPKALRGLGSHSHPISTKVPAAQRFFDQGLVLTYGFNHYGAIDAYLESIAIEPNHRAFSNIATVYMAEHRFEEAATNFEAALALDATDYRVWGNLVSAYENMPGKESELAVALAHAVDLAEARLRVAPDDATALSLASAYYAAAGRGEPSPSRSACRRLPAPPPDPDPRGGRSGARGN